MSKTYKCLENGLTLSTHIERDIIFNKWLQNAVSTSKIEDGVQIVDVGYKMTYFSSDLRIDDVFILSGL